MKSLESLHHVTEYLSHGGKVVLLDTGAFIDAEAEAMLQALHSRSNKGINGHLEIIKERGATNFMSNFYVGYGHKSIGDCGSVTLFIEGVSLLAAKAIQNWRLYSGQESSTRYIDFSQQKFLNIVDSPEGEEILETWRGFYLKALPLTEAHLREIYPAQPDEDEKIYKKAIMARAFDILRGYLPAGATTNLAWHSNLRQIADALIVLRNHPLQEVNNIADTLEKVLQHRYPSSFSHKHYSDTDQYVKNWTQYHYYYHAGSDYPDFAMTRNSLNYLELSEYKDILANRPIKTELPSFTEQLGELEFSFLLDFGSFRDIQRHRAISQRMPLLTTFFGMEQFHIDNLPQLLHQETQELLLKQHQRIAKLKATPEEKQYYTAIGYKVPCKITGNLRALTYLVELRATRFVHPTLRKRAKQIAEVLLKELTPYGYILHLDTDMDRFDSKRGTQDIQLNA